MRVVFTIQNENAAKRWIRDGQQLSLGRTERADWIVNHPTVSSLHCTFHCDGRDVWVEDHGSTNGTLIDGQRIQKTQLHDGQVLHVGQIRVEIEIQGATLQATGAATPESTSLPGEGAATPETPIPLSVPEPDPPLTPSPQAALSPVTPSPTAATPTTRAPDRPTRSISKRIHLFVRPPHGSQRRVTLLAGQELTLGSSEWADHPVPEDEMLAPRHLNIRYFGGRCQVTLLIDDETVCAGDRPIQSGATIEPGEVIRVGKTFIEFRPIEAGFSTELTAIQHLPLEAGHLFSAALDAVDLLETPTLKSHFGDAQEIVWPPHEMTTLLRKPRPLFGWCDVRDSPIVQPFQQPNEIPGLLFAPHENLESALETLGLVARGQAGKYSVAIAMWCWIGRPLEELPTLWATCPAKTRGLLTSKLHFLLYIGETRWWLLGDDHWLAHLRLPNADLTQVQSVDEMA